MNAESNLVKNLTVQSKIVWHKGMPIHSRSFRITHINEWTAHKLCTHQTGPLPDLISETKTMCTCHFSAIWVHGATPTVYLWMTASIQSAQVKAICALNWNRDALSPQWGDTDRSDEWREHRNTETNLIKMSF